MAALEAAPRPQTRAPALPPGPAWPPAVQAALWAIRAPQLTRAAHARFGSTFTLRLGTSPPVVVTTDRDAARRLLTGDPLTKRHGNDVLRPMVRDRSVLLLDGAEHLARRRLLLPPFHGERVQAYARLMGDLVEGELDHWRPGEVVAVLPVAQDVALEVILRAVLGISDAAERARVGALVEDLVAYPTGRLRRGVRRREPRRRSGIPGRAGELAQTLATLPSPAVLTFFPEIKGRENLVARRWWTLRDRVDALLDVHIEAVRADRGLAERDDVLALLVQARDDDGRGLSTADLRDELWALIAAGHETTAATLAWATQRLAFAPEVQERAAAAVAAGDRRFVQALVREVLRLHTPVSLAAVRILDEPFEVDGHLVPAGTQIAIDGPNIHLDPELWPAPHELRPERYLGDGAPPYAWLPFGGGARRCIGAALAELEVEVALTAILRRFRLLPAAPRPEAGARRAIVLVPHAGGRVRLAAR